jgi:hypothetical protein
MRLITAITSDYKELSDLMLRRTNKAGYPIKRINLPDSYRVVQSEGWQALSPWKPEIILDELSQSNELLVWIDGDACALKNFDEVDSGDYDFAVTVRHGPVDYYRRINAGVLFFYPTRKAFDFLEQWIDEIPNTPHQSDQQALNQLLNPAGCKTCPCEVYNFCDWHSDPLPETKIVHCLTEYRARGVEWLRSVY